MLSMRSLSVSSQGFRQAQSGRDEKAGQKARPAYTHQRPIEPVVDVLMTLRGVRQLKPGCWRRAYWKSSSGNLLPGFR